MIYDFLKENQNTVKWVALGVIILQALIFLLAIIVWTTNRPMEYNYDDELIALRQQIQQPLINRPTPPEQLRLLLVPLINVLAEMILGVPIREKIRA